MIDQFYELSFIHFSKVVAAEQSHLSLRGHFCSLFLFNFMHFDI